MSDEQARKDLYAETRKDLLSRQLSNSERFDTAVLTLSTGALGASLAFISNVVPLERAQCLILLRVSWWLFGVSIGSTMLSFLASQRGIARQLEYAEAYYLQEVVPDHWTAWQRI